MLTLGVVPLITVLTVDQFPPTLFECFIDEPSCQNKESVLEAELFEFLKPRMWADGSHFAPPESAG